MMSRLDMMNNMCYLNCEREYKLDEMAFILAIADILDPIDKSLSNLRWPCETIEKYQDYLNIYTENKTWLKKNN